jgi:K+-transporting ATPase ATPase C chain
MRSLLRPAVVLFLFFTVLTGFLYPLAITGVARLAFPQAAAGSILIRAGKPIGSTLIGQSFSDPKYFWGRLSATTPQPYAGTASSGSNLGPLNPALTDAVKALYQAPRVARVRGLDVIQVRRLVAAQSQQRVLGLFGEPSVNVLALNLALDSLAPATGSR